MPYLSRIIIYPIKSLSPVTVPESRIVEGGGLEHDREFGFFDENGKFVNGKRTPRIHSLSATINRKDGVLSLRDFENDNGADFDLSTQRVQIDEWLSTYFAMPVHLRQNYDGGFPDDKAAPGPTLIGDATLREVTSWYEGLTLSEVRVRFRTNLEISDAPAFWEDKLFGGPDEFVRFQIGNVQFEGTNPCQRCIVPTRDTVTGDQTADFATIFRERRQSQLPDWANPARFNHFYRLALNTRVPETEVGKTLRVGDEVTVIGLCRQDR